MYTFEILPVWALLLISTVGATRRVCPPCPAAAPCHCTNSNSEALQLLVCPQVEFPELKDESANFSADHYCDLRIVNSSFTEIPANAFAQVHRFHVEIGETNSRFSLLKGFAFNGLSVREIELRFAPNSSIQIEAKAFASDLEEVILYSANGTIPARADSFLGADSLRTLGISMASVPHGFFQHLAGLEELSIQSSGRALAIEPGAFLGLANLEMLLLHSVDPGIVQRNLFEGLTSRLHHLTLGGQSLLGPVKTAALPADVFADLKGLGYVSLRNLQLSTIPASLLKLKNLTHLSLEDNQLSSEDLDRKINASHWKNLRRIDLGFNNLETVPKFLQHLKSLETAFVQSSPNEDQTRLGLACDSRLCWLGNWSAAFQSHNSTTSKAVALHATCIPKECKRPTFESVQADVREFVVQSAECNVSTDVRKNFIENIQQPQRDLEQIYEGVKKECLSKASGDKKDGNAAVLPLKSGSVGITAVKLGWIIVIAKAVMR